MNQIICYGYEEFRQLADGNERFIDNIKALEKKAFLTSEIDSKKSFKLTVLSDFFNIEKKLLLRGHKKLEKKELTNLLCTGNFQENLRREVS